MPRPPRLLPRLTPLIAVLCALAAPAMAQEETPTLSLPIDCTLGADCLVQQLPDMDGGPGVADPFCGTASYDGHKGTDIGLRSLAAVERGTAVLAPAPGTVAGTRDGEPDRVVTGDADLARVAGRECGNGVGIDHGDGWFTQVCHLREGSVRVEPGQRVERGQALGQVGYSGMAAFAHVHLQLMRDGEPVDPSTGGTVGEGCEATGEPLWDEAAREAIEAAAATRFTQSLGVGVASGPVDVERVWAEGRPSEPSGDNPPIAVAWGAAINLVAGDVMRVELVGESGVLATNEMGMERPRARQLLFAGVRSPGEPVRARLTVLRKGEAVLEAERGVLGR